MTDDEVDALVAQERAPKKGFTDAEVDAMVRGGGAPAQAAAPAPAEPPKPGFFRRAADSIQAGATALYNVAGDQLKAANPVGLFSPEGRALAQQRSVFTNPAKRHEFERGVGDVVTLGYGNKLAEHVDKSFAEAFPGTFERHMAPEQQAAEAAAAPGYSTAGQAVGTLMPNILAKAGGAVLKPVAAVAERLAPAATAAVKGAAATIASKVGSVPIAGNVVKSLGSYEATAPAQAALSADAEGHRMQAAGQAATDPLGVSMATVLGAGASARNKVLNSEGAKSRRYIEQHGEGAKVTLFNPGKRGVFESQLKGVPTTDAGFGQAEEIGAQNIVNDIEVRHEAKHGYPYRGGGELVRGALETAKESAAQGKLDILDAKEGRRKAVMAAKKEVLAETAQRGEALLSKTEDARREVGSKVGAGHEAVDASGAADGTRDMAPIVKHLREASRDLSLSHDVRTAILDDLNLLETYREAPPPPRAAPPARGRSKKGSAPLIQPDDHVPGLSEAMREDRKTAKGPAADQLDRLIAAQEAKAPPPASKKPATYMVPEWQINGYRKHLMERAGVGESDAPGRREAPLRAAAFAVKQMVDEGPFAPINKEASRDYNKVEAERKGVGLKAKPQRDRAVEREKLTLRLRKGIDDPSMIPGGENVPPEAQLGPLREKLGAARDSADPVVTRVRTENKGARQALKEARARRSAGDKAAVADRQLLGLGLDIGTEKADVNQVALALGHRLGESPTSGRSQERIDLDAYRAAHPDQATNTRLADLMRQRGNLELKAGDARHGGITHKLRPYSLLGAVQRNAAPITGRFLAGPAEAIDPIALSAALGRLRGTQNAKEKRP